MEQPIKITTKKAEEEERLQREALEELKIICHARNVEIDAFSYLNQLMQDLTKEYNDRNYKNQTIHDILVHFAILEELHSEITDLELAKTDSEHEEATQALKKFFEEDGRAAVQIMDNWGIE